MRVDDELRTVVNVEAAASTCRGRKPILDLACGCRSGFLQTDEPGNLYVHPP